MTAEPHLLNYTVLIRTKEPIDEDTERIVTRTINLNIWKTLDKCLPRGINCIVDGNAKSTGKVLDELEKWIDRKSVV